MEAYWSRQEGFAEMMMRDTAAEIRDVSAQLDEVLRQLRHLEGSNESSDAVTDASDVDEETESVSSQIAEDSQSQLLDTLACRLSTPSQNPQTPQPDFRSNRAGPSRRTTWADRAAIVGKTQRMNGRGYVHSSYQGHGVSTVKRVDDSGSKNM
jgi:hypothetical protein